MQSQGESKEVISSPKMLSLWKRAIDSNKALLLDEPNVSPNDLLKRAEEFDNATRAAEHSSPAIISTKEGIADNAAAAFEDGWRSNGYDGNIMSFDGDEDLSSMDHLFNDNSHVPPGSLPIDSLAKKLWDK